LKKNYTKDLVNTPFKKIVLIQNQNFNPISAEVLYGIKNQGEMFTYERPTVPYTFYPIVYKDSISARFFAETIDDASMGFFISVNNMEEYYEIFKFVENWLLSFSDMPSIEEFEEIFSQFKEIQFDYN